MYLAEINKENSIVKRVIMHEDGPLPDWATESEESFWVESASDDLSKRFAAVGDTYFEHIDAFVAPKPYPSWILDDEAAQWTSPTPHPDPDPMVSHLYFWDEETTQWIFIEKDPPPGA